MFEKKTINPIYDICFYLPYNNRVKVIRGGGFFKSKNTSKTYFRQQRSMEIRYIGGIRICMKRK